MAAFIAIFDGEVGCNKNLRDLRPKCFKYFGAHPGIVKVRAKFTGTIYLFAVIFSGQSVRLIYFSLRLVTQSIEVNRRE